jgi:Ca2+-binding RTX toxin-like protein
MEIRNLKMLMATAAVALFSFAAVAGAATINDDDVGHVLKGTNSADTINGNGGNDTINAKRGRDTLDGGLGDDVVKAGDGRDNSNGGEGNDTMYGGWGNDVQYGGPGNDLIFAGRGRDITYGGDGNDTLWALARGDVHGRHDRRGDSLTGGEGDDLFRTRDGERDLIDCGPGNDTAVLDWKDRIIDATKANKNGSCEHVYRKARAAADAQENVNP